MLATSLSNLRSCSVHLDVWFRAAHDFQSRQAETCTYAVYAVQTSVRPFVPMIASTRLWPIELIMHFAILCFILSHFLHVGGRTGKVEIHKIFSNVGGCVESDRCAKRSVGDVFISIGRERLCAHAVFKRSVLLFLALRTRLLRSP